MEESSGEGVKRQRSSNADGDLGKLEEKAEASGDYAAKDNLEKAARNLKPGIEALKKQRSRARSLFAFFLPPMLALVLFTVLPKYYLAWGIVCFWGFCIFLYAGWHSFLCLLVWRKMSGAAARHQTQCAKRIKRFLYGQKRLLPNLADTAAREADEIGRLKKVVKQDLFIFIICSIVLLDIAVFSTESWSAPVVLLILEGLGLFILSDKMDMPETHELIDRLLNQTAEKMKLK